MDDQFKIFVEQLREGKEQQIQESLAPDFLDVQDEDLTFDRPVELKGVTYLAEDELILHWDIHTTAKIPCSICNDQVEVPVDITNFYASEALEEIKTGIYNFKDLLRETILLEVPPFVECHGGSCPKRKEFDKYLKKPSESTPEQEDGYQPFADLDWKP